MRLRPRSAPAAWVVFLGLGVLLVGVHALLPLMTLDQGTAQERVYDLQSFAAVVAVVTGVCRNRPAHRPSWWLLALGQAANFVGDLWYGASDYCYLTSYAIIALGLFLMIRRRTPAWDLASGTDAAVVAVSAGILSWIFLISPKLPGDGEPMLRSAITLAYPLGDLLTLVLAARLVLGAGLPAVALRLLAAGLFARLAGDVVYGMQPVFGAYASGGLLDRTWMISTALIGAAALHPSMRQVAEPAPAAAPIAGPGRLTLLAVASVTAPAVLLVQALRGAPLYAPLIATSCIVLFLLVVLRMAGLVTAQRRMAITDALTGLHTRRYFEEALRQEEQRAARTGQVFGVVMVDVDHFKQINDTYGHHGGDVVLCEVAHRVRALVRADDVVARFGGEEFIVLLRDAPAPRLDEIAQALCRGVGGVPIAVGDRTTVTVTVSVGSAVLQPGQANAEEVIFAADRALYAAKRSGRNRAVAAVAPGETAATGHDVRQPFADAATGLVILTPETP